MAQTIHILPEHLANKIAAGEVVQRPASVVKELLENSLDAGADTLTVIIQDGGKSLIQVVDNGVGMSSEDVAVAFERHATSKISSYDDLENIRTLGFRGEALASIAAVARVELRTRQRGEAVGTRVRVEGGEIKETAKDSLEHGTSVAVRNLFYNTPARRNFLKSNNTEFKHVYDVVQRVALAYPEFHIRFLSDGDTVLDVRRSTLDERVKDLFGEHQAEGLVAVHDTNDLVELRGYVSKPDYARKTRVEQYLFLNGRYIVNRSINHAVFQAYEHLLEKGSFPFFILYLAIDPRRIDVNVHPSKMEVKFDDERGVYRAVMHAVRKALVTHDLAPSMEKTIRESEMQTEAIRGRGGLWRELLRPAETISKRTGEIFPQNSPASRQLTPMDQNSQTSFAASQGPLWQVHNKYIVVPTHEGLMIIDQHVAHERVLYERIVERFSSNTATGQHLLFSHTVELNAGDAALVKHLEPDLAAMGFVLKLFGKNTVVLEAVPADVKTGKETTILQELIDLYKENEHNVKLEPRENLAKSFSCKAAIKAGDPLTESEMRTLVDQLFETNNPFVCPHGRPVIVKLSLTELDKRFGRPT